MLIENKEFIMKIDFDILQVGDYYLKSNLLGDYIKWEKVDDDTIIFTTNHLGCPRISHCKTNNDFVFDLGRCGIEPFVTNHFEDVYKEVTETPQIYFKKSVLKDYKLNHCNYIENWSKLILKRDGSFEKIDYPMIPYSVNLKDAYDIVHKWLLKYKKGVNDYINHGIFFPTITGGLDTRYLSSLYKDRISEIPYYYIRDVKLDGKNEVELGLADLECSIKVSNTLGIKDRINEFPNGKITISGMFSEATRGMYTLDINEPIFIYKFIQHHNFSGNLLFPYADDLFLIIKQPNKDVFRCLLCLLLCPELMDLECIGTKETFKKHNYKSYNFYEEYKESIKEAQEILDYWGKEKCDNILNEDY